MFRAIVLLLALTAGGCSSLTQFVGTGTGPAQPVDDPGCESYRQKFGDAGYHQCILSKRG